MCSLRTRRLKGESARRASKAAECYISFCECCEKPELPDIVDQKILRELTIQ